MGLFEGLVLNNTNPKSDNTETNKFNNDTHNQISGNGYKPVDYKNISQMDNLNPKIINTQSQNIYTMEEINPFDTSSGNPILSAPQNMEPDPFSISDTSNHNISEIDPFQINTPSESLPTETDNTPQPKQDTQPRSIFSPEHVRDPFGLESEQVKVPTKQEGILGKIGKYFFKK